MASIWDFLNSLPKRGDVSPEELAARRQGYADLYQGGLLARNRDQMPLSVQGAQATQDFLPVIGDALALGEAGEALSRGELAAAGLLGAGAAIGLVPGAGDALAKPVMAAGRRAADIARRIEVDPYALGSMGGNIRLKPEDVTPAQEAAGLLSPSFDEYLSRVNPQGSRIPAEARPNLMMGDMYGMLPSNAKRVGGRDGVQFYEVDGDFYATAYNPDVGEMDVVGYAVNRGDMTDLQVVGEMQSSGIGSELQYLYRRANPDALSGGLTEAGERSLRRTYDRLAREGIIAPRATTTPAQEVAGLLSSGRVDEVTDEMLAKLTPKDEMELFDLYQRGATGMDLPMDEASRMARAVDQGREADRFHGAMGDYTDLRPSVRGKIGPGVYTAEEPNYANSFAGKVYGEEEYLEGGNVYPLRVKSNPAPEMFRTEAGALRRSVSDPYEGADLFSAYLDELGFSGARVGGEETTVNPSNIRSRFARFDPRLAHLRNLSAGVGGLGLLSSIMPQEEQY